MFHYLIKVPSGGKTLTAKETVISRLNKFNDNSNHLMFDSSDENEKRFIFVSEEEASDDVMTKLKSIFETEVKAEKIDDADVDGKTLKKIHAAKELMTNDDCCSGKSERLLVTESVGQLLEKADAMIGFTEFKEFLRGFADYIDRTAEIAAKSMYNVALINKCGARLDPHINLIVGILAAKGLLLEQIMVKGDIHELGWTDRETQFAYVIEDEWKTEDAPRFCENEEAKLLSVIFGGDTPDSATAMGKIRLFSSLKESRNIYITSMTADEYGKISKLDGFDVAFPHTVTIDELTEEEKTDYIRSVAGEYGFAVNTKGFAGNPLIGAMTPEQIENAVRKTVCRKLIAKDELLTVNINDFLINISDRKNKANRKKSGFDELEAMIGLDGVKRTIREITMFLQRRGKAAVPCLHMAFLGNPGTGKTTVARIVAKIFAETGVIKKDLFVETQKGGLIGEYLGQTAPKTAKVIEKALGGVLFIDEAYALYSKEEDIFANEAIATLVKLMEDKRDEFVCIMAGYTKEMNDMLDMNPGMRDRIQFCIDFPDYDESELFQIFEGLCKENKYKLSPSARDTLKNGIYRLVAAKPENFSNGRIMRKLFERARMKQALRTKSDIITEKDLEAAFAEPDISALLHGGKHCKIGFVA